MKREDESEQQGGPPKRRPDRPSSFLDFQVACSPLFPSSSIADLESASSSAVAVNKFFDLPSSPVQMLGVSTALGGAAAEVFSKNNEQEQQQQKTLPPFQHYRKSTNHHHHHHGNKNAVDMLSMSTITVPPTDKDLVAGGGGNLNVSNRALTSLSQPCLPVCVQGPTKILPFVYLGSQQDVLDEETLKKYGIEFVLNLSTTCPKPDHLQEEHFLRIPVQDSYSEELLPYFEEAFEFLDKVREASGVALIHCLAGISRSPTLAIAYVMRYLHMSQDEAYRYVKEKRPSISPNFNFLGQLLEYEQYLLNTNRKEFEKFPTGHSAIKSAQISPVINNRDQNQPIPQISKSRTMMTLPFAKNNDDTIPEYYGKRRLLDQNFLPENLRRNFYQQEILCGNANFMKNSVLSDNQDLPSPSTELSKLNFGGNANTSHVTISCNNRDSNINRVIKPPSLNLRLKSNFDDQKATSSKMNPMFDDGPNDQNSILKNDIPMDIQENSKFDEQKTNFYSNPKILFPAVDQQVKQRDDQFQNRQCCSAVNPLFAEQWPTLQQQGVAKISTKLKKNQQQSQNLRFRPMMLKRFLQTKKHHQDSRPECSPSNDDQCSSTSKKIGGSFSQKLQHFLKATPKRPQVPNIEVSSSKSKFSTFQSISTHSVSDELDCNNVGEKSLKSKSTFNFLSSHPHHSSTKNQKSSATTKGEQDSILADDSYSSNNNNKFRLDSTRIYCSTSSLSKRLENGSERESLGSSSSLEIAVN